MPSNSDVITEELIEVDEKVSKIRKIFLEDFELNNELYDECDVLRVRQSDWTVKRFLLSNNNNEEAALKSLTEALQWKKSYGVNTRTDQYFPEDFYKIGGIFQYETDKNGLPLLYVRVCVHHKVQELIELIRQFFVHLVNKIDVSSGGEWAVVFDSSNSGISNVDMDFSRFIVQVLQHYYPKGYKYVLIYNMPWIMVAFWKITRAWVADEVKQLIKFANGPQIFDFIDAESVPQYIPGGKCPKPINFVPEGVKSPELLPHLNFTIEQIQKFRTIFSIKNEDNGSANEDNENRNDDNGNPSEETTD